MKARRKGTNEPFQKVTSVCLCSGGYILIKDVEFEQEPNTVDYWQDLRNRAAIAAMQGLILSKFDYFSEIKIAKEAIKCADALVEKLKEEKL